MTSITEKGHDGGFLMSEADGHLSRENVTLVAGQNLAAGAVLGKITASGKYSAVNEAGSDGTQTAAGILLNGTDASAADVAVAIIARDAEVNGNELSWGSQSPTNQAAAIIELAAINIRVR